MVADLLLSGDQKFNAPVQIAVMFAALRKYFLPGAAHALVGHPFGIDAFFYKIVIYKFRPVYR